RDQFTIIVAVLDLDVGQSGLAAWAPVDDPLGLVDQAVFEQSLEDRADRSRQTLVHGETLARPIHAVAQAFHLAEALPAVLFFPLPDPLDEPLAGQIVTGLALGLCQMPFHERLSGDARVVRPR